jgi:hypothetical protein
MGMSGIELIAAERQRQIDVEGWRPEHDDQHKQGELAEAASSYSDIAAYQSAVTNPTIDNRRPMGWPFDSTWWKPSDDPIRNCVKAAALLAAEIDRLQRAKEDKEQK